MCRRSNEAVRPGGFSHVLDLTHARRPLVEQNPAIAADAETDRENGADQGGLGLLLFGVFDGGFGEPCKMG